MAMSIDGADGVVSADGVDGVDGGWFVSSLALVFRATAPAITNAKPNTSIIGESVFICLKVNPYVNKANTDIDGVVAKMFKTYSQAAESE